VLRIEQITMNGTINLEKCDSIDSHRLEDFKYILVQEGDVLLSLTGQLIKPAIVPKLNEPVLQNYRVGKFVPKNENELYKKYVYYLLNSVYIMKQLLMLRNVQAQPNIGKADFEKIKTMLPSFLEQQKITSILSNVDSLIESYDKIIESTRKIKVGLMQHLLTKGFGHKKFKKVELGRKFLKMQIPTEWNLSKLNDFASVHGRIGWKNLRADEYTETGHLMLSVWSLHF